jgi:glucose uptake protein GlcU
MASPELIFICLSAFIAVFLILSILAIFMHMITGIFSVKETKEDSAIIAVLTSIVNHYYPGKKITKIEESK